ncbi:hypothetical protein [Microbispora sp. KK1-11]|uniref:hypothetical protein n=1 Tax=Microbispora sp. KK1-11 TaxID=2053005 RepID=UPI00115BB66D|nr:hypothetical protein [Microbispora sp. KK1-11]TQS31188.1 hypothetical protein FLW16_02670 [Microbispora sp. KK1-11]
MSVEVRNNVRVTGRPDGRATSSACRPGSGWRGIAEAVVNEAVAFQPGLPRDDIAVVVFKIPA